MKSINTVVALAAIVLMAGIAEAAQIKASVNGMVCSFCAQGIEKKFKANPAVESIKVDLDKKMVMITTKEGKTLSQEEVRKVITDAGFKVESIEVK